MKNKIVFAFPFIIMPAFIPIYNILDSLILVDIFGCGCVPIAQTNMLNIPFNANDLRLTVFTVLVCALSVWSVFISKKINNRAIKILYCLSVILFNFALTIYVVKAFMWD